MAVAREAEPVGSLREVQEAGLDREDLLGSYRALLTTRDSEERGHIADARYTIPQARIRRAGAVLTPVGEAFIPQADDVLAAPRDLAAY